MPRDQVINYARRLGELRANLDLDAKTLRLSQSYSVGSSGQVTQNVPDPNNPGQTISVTSNRYADVPGASQGSGVLELTLQGADIPDAVMKWLTQIHDQIPQAIAAQEGLDLTKGDEVL